MSTMVIGLQQPVTWKQRFWYYVNSVYDWIQIRFTENASAKPMERTQTEDVNVKAARLIQDYGNGILRMAYSYLQNMDDAEEILQETLIQFLTKTPEFENTEHEKAWLLHVAANLSKNRIKYNKIRMTDELDETLVAEEKEDLAFVWEAVKSLPEKYREVIHLHYQEGYQTAQIAKILNRREATIRSDLRRGREKLRVILKEAYDFE